MNCSNAAEAHRCGGEPHTHISCHLPASHRVPLHCTMRSWCWSGRARSLRTPVRRRTVRSASRPPPPSPTVSAVHWPGWLVACDACGRLTRWCCGFTWCMEACFLTALAIGSLTRQVGWGQASRCPPARPLLPSCACTCPPRRPDPSPRRPPACLTHRRRRRLRYRCPPAGERPGVRAQGGAAGLCGGHHPGGEAGRV